MEHLNKNCEKNNKLWRDCMYTWEGSKLENTCKKFKLRFERCKSNEINGPKKIIKNKIEKTK